MAELELEIVEVVVVVIVDDDNDDDDDDDDNEFKRAFESNFVRGLAIGLRLQTEFMGGIVCAEEVEAESESDIDGNRS